MKATFVAHLPGGTASGTASLYQAGSRSAHSQEGTGQGIPADQETAKADGTEYQNIGKEHSGGGG